MFDIRVFFLLSIEEIDTYWPRQLKILLKKIGLLPRNEPVFPLSWEFTFKLSVFKGNREITVLYNLVELKTFSELK